jgi:hypothetical protein
MLTDSQTRALRPDSKLYRRADGRGLYIEVTPSGGKRWLVRFRGPPERYEPIGEYPTVSLKQARDLAASLKSAKTHAGGRTFETVAREFLAMQAPRRRATYVKERSRELERDVFAELGGLPIASISGPQVLATLRKVEGRGVGTLPGRLRNLIIDPVR